MTPNNIKEKARLTWRCRRGMLELDLILHRFLEQYLGSMSKREIDLFDELLDHTDPELFAWLMGHEDPKRSELLEMVSLIRDNT